MICTLLFETLTAEPPHWHYVLCLLCIDDSLEYTYTYSYFEQGVLCYHIYTVEVSLYYLCIFTIIYTSLWKAQYRYANNYIK